MATDIKDGYKSFQHSVSGLERIDENIMIPIRVMIHIVPGTQDMPCGPAAVGCASGGDIYVIGYRHKGQIIVNQAILGHELMHLLNWENRDIVNPDTLCE